MKNILVSGGSRGIGRACIEYFSSIGYNVAFIYHSNDFEAERTAKEFGAFAIKADISFPSQVEKAVENAVDFLGDIDVLVNNAGVSQIKLITDVSDDDWRKVIDINLSGAFYLCRAVLPFMISKKSGKIINIGSMWGKCGASCEVAYSASKAGLSGFTKALAKEVAPSGITVNCVEPGVIDTDMNKDLDKETICALCEETPLGRLGKAQDVANLVGFLASDKADFITGQIIGVDGGFAI